MRDKELYRRILGIGQPWRVTDVELDLTAEEVTVHVEHTGGRRLRCPKCDRPCPGYDRRQRRWRHLDTCQLKTVLAADVPRVECSEHGVVTIGVPWAEPGSGFTAMFEALVIGWLREASTEAVRRRLGLSWNAVDGIMQRAVDRGLERRGQITAEHITVDETSFRKRHDYVTVVSDWERGIVVHVSDDRTEESLGEFYDSLSERQRNAIETVSMDMWAAYIGATRKALPDADQKIGFDRYHVAQHLGNAVDKVRRQEHRSLMAHGDETLKGTRYDWLTNPSNMDWHQCREFKALRESSLKTARAWAIKDSASHLWNYASRTWALKSWKRWLSWASRSRLGPIRKVARMIRRHLWGIINAIVLRADNALAESMNSRIKTVKVRSRGFRNKTRFRRAIYFHLGGLNLCPKGLGR